MSGFGQAASLVVENCDENCSCQSVHILLLDKDDQVIAAAMVSTEHARAIADDLNQKADFADAQLVRSRGRLA